MSTTTVSTTERSGGSVGASAGTPAAVTTDPVTHRSQALTSHDTSQPTPAQRPRGSVLPSPNIYAAEKNTVRVRLDDMDLPNSVHRDTESY